MNSSETFLPVRDQEFVREGRNELEYARWLTVLAGQPRTKLVELAQETSLKGQAAQALLQERRQTTSL
ncbi:MAG: hypothetical protein ACXAB4_05885 [Candidatus Hodarchaeales archaeon]